MKSDIISNYLEKGVNIVLRFFMIPIYLNNFGSSAYGLIGFYTTITSMMVLFDFGMGYASMKLLAENEEGRDAKVIGTLKSVELVYLAISFLLGASVILASSWISQGWLSIDDKTLQGDAVIQLMGLLLLVSWPQSLYQSFISGQKKFLQMNVALISINICYSVSLIYFVQFRNKGVNIYFIVMIAAMLLQTIVLRYLAWRDLPRKAPFASLPEMKHFFTYASGVTVFSLTSLFMFQGPAFFISSLLKTSDLGLFNIAQTFPMAMLTLLYPITSACFPRLVKIRENSSAVKVFFLSNSMLNIITICFVFVLGLNMKEIYTMWLPGNDQVAVISHISKIQLAGVFLYACQMIVTSTFIANGHTKALSGCYIFSVLVFCVSVAMTAKSGVAGVATSWLIMQASLILALAVSLYIHYRDLCWIWCRTMAKNFALLLVITALFAALTYDSFFQHALSKLLLSGVLLAAVFAFPLKNIYSRFSLNEN